MKVGIATRPLLLLFSLSFLLTFFSFFLSLSLTFTLPIHSLSLSHSCSCLPLLLSFSFSLFRVLLILSSLSISLSLPHPFMYSDPWLMNVFDLITQIMTIKALNNDKTTHKVQSKACDGTTDYLRTKSLHT